VAPLVKTHGESASQITGSADAAVQAAVRREEQPEEAAQAVEGLAASVRDFEASHPRLVQIVDVSTRPLGGSLVIGAVLRFHVDDSLFDNYKIDPDKLQAIGRMGGPTYTRTTDRFDMIRPKTGGKA